MTLKSGHIDLDIPLRRPGNRGLYIFAIFFAVEILLGTILWHPIKGLEVGAEAQPPLPTDKTLLVTQGNSLLQVNNLVVPSPDTKETLQMIVTAYSSTPGETDGNPYVTAAGTYVRPGIVANNLLSIGTKVRLPELYGEQVFIVEDRMNSRKSGYQLDIWFPSYWEAKSFGVKQTYIEVLES